MRRVFTSRHAVDHSSHVLTKHDDETDDDAAAGNSISYKDMLLASDAEKYASDSLLSSESMPRSLAKPQAAVVHMESGSGQEGAKRSNTSSPARSEADSQAGDRKGANSYSNTKDHVRSGGGAQGGATRRLGLCPVPGSPHNSQLRIKSSPDKVHQPGTQCAVLDLFCT